MRLIMVSALSPSEVEEYDYASLASRVDNIVARRTPGVSTEELVDRILVFAEAIAGHKFYPYQRPFAYRVVYCVLERLAEELSALFARQSGKSEALAMITSSLMFVMPSLAKAFPDDDRFSYQDPKTGDTRDYSEGFWTAIFAPKKDQAGIIFSRVKGFFNRDTVKQMCSEEGITFTHNNGDTLRLSNGSYIKCSTASDQSSIEGYTLHLGILEESQDISDEKASKSIGPMMAAVGGTIVKIGTSNAKKSHFYKTCKRNERRYRQGGAKNHFLVRWDEAAKYNSDYERFVLKEMARLGERSDEFRMSYCCEFMLARGMAFTDKVLSSLCVTRRKYAPFHEILGGPMMGRRYAAGIDFGKVHDSTVVTILDVDWDNPRQTLEGFDEEEGAFTLEIFGKHLVSWMEMQGDDYEAQFLAIQRYLRPWGAERIALDYTGVGVALGDKFKAHYDDCDVEFVSYSDQSKDMLGRLILSDVATGMITFPGGPSTVETTEYKEFWAQMLDLEKEYKAKSGYLALHHPNMRGAKDDYCDSLQLAIYAASKRPHGGDIEESENVFSMDEQEDLARLPI
ncbi:MAG: hypothetical protein GF334_08200 [Candidatus Altiarchaeales archaeon]|nr:hypothetical protein [Candidatus Altiarchaeales archaeon]